MSNVLSKLLLIDINDYIEDKIFKEKKKIFSDKENSIRYENNSNSELVLLYSSSQHS